MLNYWWVTRPKRKLNSIPEVLSTYAEISLDQEWQGQRDSHLSLEDALEEAGLKRPGERRDHTGGGGRTYQAWVSSLGLIFTQQSTGKMKLTLAGEAIMNGDSPVSVLTGQILKYQFPSSFSMSRGVCVSPRFHIRPFRFLLRLLNDSRVQYLTQEEIAKIIIVEAEKETNACFEYIVKRIAEFRERGNACLAKDFSTQYTSSKGSVNKEKPYDHLLDIANTIINWMEYTQLARRDENRNLAIVSERQEDVNNILAENPPFIDRPEQHEYFQRKYGIDPKHRKDTRDLTGAVTVTAKIIAEQKIRNAFIGESLKAPIAKISSAVIDKVTELTGIDSELVEDTLLRWYPHGAIGSFMTEYQEMAFKGREDATDFEKATVAIFRDSFGFTAEHVGPIGLTPDVLLLSDAAGYQAIIDNKAYSKYSISNDHRNRMVHNYIGQLSSYSKSAHPLAFFSYIAGGFGNNISMQIKSIADETGVAGSAVSVFNIIKLAEENQRNPYSHDSIRDIFSKNRLIELKDL